MINTKRIGKSGGVTIPANLRRELGVAGGEKVNISVANDGSIIIKRIEGNCLLCGSYEGLTIFNKKPICRSCIEKIKKL